MERILFTNDDGYESVLLHDLYHYVKQKYQKTQCMMMAPHKNRSGISHAITLGKPLVFREKEEDRYEVEGYPADCTMVSYGIFGSPDIVLSGPNFGSNLGQDILYSGTVGAAREAALHNIPALAFSFVDDDRDLAHVNYDHWHSFLDKWLDPLIALAINNPSCIVNVNISIPIDLELEEGTLGSRYYYNYQSYETGKDHKGEYFAAIPKEGIDASKEVEKNSDVHFMLQGKNVFNVFSAWPKLKPSKKEELLSYMKAKDE